MDKRDLPWWFVDKWGSWFELRGSNLIVESKHLYRRWNVSFECDVERLKTKSCMPDITILYSEAAKVKYK